MWVLLVLVAGCGCVPAARSAMHANILGGENASVAKYPHSVYLLLQMVVHDDGTFETAFCGGSLISQQVVLTAGHCVDGHWKTVAYMGHEIPINASVIREVSKVMFHPNFHFDKAAVRLKHDIGIALLKTPVVFSGTVKKVLLPSPSLEYGVGSTAAIAGWGQTSREGKSPKLHQFLQHIRQTLQEHHTCDQHDEISKLSGEGCLSRGVFCAGHTDSLKEQTYFGDSGSALVTGEDNHIQIGVTSYIFTSSLSFYTNVTVYREWVLQAIHAIMC